MDSKKDLVGHTPGGQFADDDYGLKLAAVQRVDEVNMKVDLKILTGSASERFEVSMTQAMYGPRSFWGGVPEVGSIAVIGYKRLQSKLHDAVILGYLPTATRTSGRFDPIASDNPASIDPETFTAYEKLFGPTKRFKRLYLRSGEVGGMSAAGAEFLLSKDMCTSNRAGDSIELRDHDRTLSTSSIHKITNEAGVRRISGPIRRSAAYLPEDIFEEGLTLRSEEGLNPYYGSEELQEAGPGADKGKLPRFATTEGQVSDIFNDTSQFTTVVYSNGKRTHYPSTIRGENIDDPDAGADAFVEDRMELSHTTDLTQEVVEELDGFSMDRRLPYIERVYGTLVGNTLNSTNGQRKYAQVLKPKLFEDFTSNRLGKLTFEAVDRSPTSPDTAVNTQAGAYMFRIRPPGGTRGEDNAFTMAVSKQGKMFVSAPGSTEEEYASGSKNISAEVSLGGALKAFIGASTPDRISAHITLEGGVHLDIGRDSGGNAVTTHYHSGVKTIADGNPNEDDVAVDDVVTGVKMLTVTGADKTLINGSRVTTSSGLYKTEADRYSLNAFSGMSVNTGEYNLLVSGKTQLNHALAVLETIAFGGKTTTVLAGGVTQTIVAGAATYTTTAGATTFNNPAGAFGVNVGTGAFTVVVGAGALSLTTAAGAVSIGAGAGAISITAGLALNLTASTVISLVAPQVLVGGPAAVLGVSRGLPAMPPGTPSLDYITNLPLQGSAVFRSF